MSATVHHIHSETFAVSGADLPLIPEGSYVVSYKSHATANMFGGHRLILRFQVVEGVYSGTVLEAFYMVGKLIDKPGKRGRFKVSKRSKFVRDFLRATKYMPERLDRIPMTRLRGRRITARVKTVEKDYERDAIPKELQYSKISKLLDSQYLASS